MVIKRGEVYWVNLDPTIGTEIKKTHPALIVSPDDLNAALPRVIIAPLTSKGQPLGCHPKVKFKGKSASSCSINCVQWTNAALPEKWEQLTWRSGIRFCLKCWHRGAGNKETRATGGNCWLFPRAS